MAAVPPVYTVRQAMICCGVNDVDLFEGCTKAQRIAEEIFKMIFILAWTRRLRIYIPILKLILI